MSSQPNWNRRRTLPTHSPPPALILPHSRRLRRLPSAAQPTTPIVRKRHASRRAPSVPPALFVTHSVERRLPGTGLSATSFVAPRRRVVRQVVRFVVPPKSRRKRIGVAPRPAVGPRSDRRHFIPTPLFAGRTKRRRVPPTGQSATSFVVRRHRLYDQPPMPTPQAGRRRRGRVPPTGQSATSFVVRRHRGLRPIYLPPFAGRKVRRRLPNLGINPGSIAPRRRKPSALARQPLPRNGKPRRGKLIGLGQTLTKNVIRRRIGRRRQEEPLLVRQVKSKRHGPAPALGRGSPIGGPYIMTAGELYVAGAVVGTVEVMP